MSGVVNVWGGECLGGECLGGEHLTILFSQKHNKSLLGSKITILHSML